MIKELSIGAGLAVIIGLIWAGINLYPLLFVIGLFYLLLITTEFGGGSNKISSFNVGDNKVPQISFEDIGGQS
ncbi:MAG: ATPase, partial [Firmicutes bacterium]|nr:ATPase [Bacillota bacterium]